MDLVKGMTCFVRVVDTGNFSGAARILSVSPGIVTRTIQQLESHLGVRLLNRTTRHLSVTDAGQAYYEFCQRILAEIQETESAIANRESRARGTLKLLAPKSFGSLHMASLISAFTDRYPEIGVSIALADQTNRSLGLVESGFDATIRLTEQKDSSLVARRIAATRWQLVAAPAYLERHGAPDDPHDIVRHECLVHGHFTSAGWPCRIGRRSLSIKGPPRLVSNSVILLAAVARLGKGLAFLPSYCIHDDLEAGRLQTVLAEQFLLDESIYVVYPARRHLPARVRLFVDFAAAWFSSAPWCLAEAPVTEGS